MRKTHVHRRRASIRRTPTTATRRKKRAADHVPTPPPRETGGRLSRFSLGLPGWALLLKEIGVLDHVKALVNLLIELIWDWLG